MLLEFEFVFRSLSVIEGEEALYGYGEEFIFIVMEPRRFGYLIRLLFRYLDVL